MNISLGYYNVNVKIIYKNNKNIYFRFDENSDLVVTCPKNTLNDEVARLIRENESSLIKMYEKHVEALKKNNEFWLLGKKYDIILGTDVDKLTIKDNTIYITDEHELEEFINSEINRVFTEEIEDCKKCFNNLPAFSWKTRKMKTRWGVCNRKNNVITLNTELIRKPIECIDYVIIHEMAHFFVGNHSKRYWEIVKLACPDYKKRRAELRK